MASTAHRQSVLVTVASQLETLASVNAKALARTPELSPTINFEPAVPYFEEMLELCRQLNQRDLSRLPTQSLDAIGKACIRIDNLVKQVREFDLNQNTPRDVCASIIGTVDSAYDEVMQPLLTPLAFTATQATDYTKLEREAKGYHATMRAEAESLKEFMTEVRNEAQAALAAVKEQAAEAGVSTNAQIFVKDADKHADLADLWQRATIWLAGATFIVALTFVGVAFYYHPTNLATAIQYVVAKLVLLSTLSFVTYWCARNFKAQKHNETVNRHRANALMTFRAFVEGTSDTRVKDALLLQAAQAAFAGRPTGFDDAEKEPHLINPVVEILGKAVPKDGA